MPCAGTGFFSISYVPSRPMVSGNAAATDQNILASERLFRLGIVSELICAVEFIFLLWVLYRSLWRGEQDVCFAIVILGYGLRSCAVAFIQRGNNISLLRKALGEDPPYVETVPKRGYRFIGAVRRLPPGSFVEEGNLTNYSRAFDYIHTEIGSEWADAVSIQILLCECKKKEALQISEPHIPQWNSYNMLVACVQQKPSSEITSLASLVRVSDDAETNYFSASHLAYCGQNTSALQCCGKPSKEIIVLIRRLIPIHSLTACAATGSSPNFVLPPSPVKIVLKENHSADGTFSTPRT